MARGKRLAAMPPQAPLYHAERSSIGARRGRINRRLLFSPISDTMGRNAARCVDSEQIRHKGEFPMLFICYPKCSTCQKAQKWLDARGVAYELRNIKEQNPTADELRAWYKMSGLPLKKFFNTSGLIYKDLGLKDKLPALSEEEQLALLATDGMLVKRPLLIGDGFALAGFREADWERALNG